jgi:hypothetical protein
VFENRVLRRIFGPKREEVAGGWRRLQYEEFHSLYPSPNIIRVMKSRRMRLLGMHTKFWLEKPEGKRPLIRPRHRWEDNLGLDLREIGWDIVDWMHLAQDKDQ